MALFALMTALLFAFQAGPGHADVYDMSDQTPAVAAHHPGDGGDSGHAGGVHCAGHCGGHSATAQGALADEDLVPPTASPYGVATEHAPSGREREPLIRPPTV